MFLFIDRYFERRRFNKTVNNLITDFFKNNPNATRYNSVSCGINDIAKDVGGKFGNCLPIGRNLWVGTTVNLSSRKINQIYIADHEKDKLSDATVVFVDKVIIAGKWQKHVIALLESAIEQKNNQIVEKAQDKKARDLLRANSWVYDD